MRQVVVTLLSVLSLVLACTPTLAPTATPTPAPTTTATPSNPCPSMTPALVVKIVDGDTIHVLIDTQDYRVRYIGIDAPETVHPTVGEQPYGREASARNHQLVLGKAVCLEKDMSETDQYGRLLRYVWLENGTMANATLVAEGYAQVTTYPPDVKYSQLFLSLQRRAHEQGMGMWGLAAPGSETPVAGRCDPAYPDVCIPSPPPDLDCADIPYRRFRVLPPDPHRLDANKDGVGCQG
ncbi:MAG: thermonuclease family protein [Chloroflexi bacterium]|nr:thermonuclease family protein [Chloroflexota bacterium]